MTYPSSSAVTAGQPTAADHYNNLRLDALYLSQADTDSVPIGTLLSRYEDNFNLVILSTNRVRCEASPTSVVALAVDGYLTQAIANVDLPAGSAPSGGAAMWYFFAVRSGSSTTFTLESNTSPSEWTNARLVGSAYWDGSAIIENSIKTSWHDYLKQLLDYYPPQACQGRLTLTTGDPLPTADQNGGSIYFSEFEGNTVSLYSPGYGWTPYEFSELTLGVPASANQAYDIFLYDDGGLTLEAVAWANDTARTTAITLQDGRWCKNGALERLWLGSFRTKTASNAYDQVLARLLFNNYNRRPRILRIEEATANWAYTGVLRQMRATAANMVELMIGINDRPVLMTQSVFVANGASSSINICFGLDSITTKAADSTRVQTLSTATGWETPFCKFFGLPGLGYHYLAPLELSSVNSTFYGGTNNQLAQGVIYA
jgi:hypothetical protein